MASLVSKRVIVLKPENVAQLVFFIRGEKAMFDADLALLYGVEVRSLNQAVARNRKRFPADFAFQLTDDELAALRSQIVISKSPTSRASSRLRSQIVTSNTGRGGRRYLPYAFTEQGVTCGFFRIRRSPEMITQCFSLAKAMIHNSPGEFGGNLSLRWKTWCSG